jgi:hypothetical protein
MANLLGTRAKLLGKRLQRVFFLPEANISRPKYLFLCPTVVRSKNFNTLFHYSTINQWPHFILLTKSKSSIGIIFLKDLKAFLKRLEGQKKMPAGSGLATPGIQG